jgi:hypothetical protein
MIKLNRIGLLAVLAIAIWGCTPTQRYENLVQEELASGKQVDSLFLGLSLGMTQKDFYTQCWEMNKEGLIRQGTSNTSVLYTTEIDGEKVEMNFYPDFYNGKIWQMPAQYNYTAWAPWNQHLSSDSLQLKILDLYKDWYGGEFIEIRNEKNDKVFVNVNGNRQISIFKMSEMTVWALFTNLLLEDSVKMERDTLSTSQNM